MMSSSTLTLSEPALQQNWNFLRSYFGKEIKISAVVKGNAYGHGIEEYIPLAEACGVQHFSVYNAGEAYRVFKACHLDTTIMIMGAMDAEDIVWAVENDIEFFVFDMHRFDAALKAAKQCSKRALVHIEMETGMYRSGFDQSEIPEIIKRLKEEPEHICFKGLCMHFAGAEHVANHVRLKKQKILFKKIHKAFVAAGCEPEMIHTCCSAAAVRFPDMRYDLLRIGIMQYGFWPSPEIKVEYMNELQKSGTTASEDTGLHRVIRWKSSVMSIKEVPAGAFVGYGYSFLAPREMTIAIVPVGYAHGFSRSLSNNGFVLIQGFRAPVIGIVNMNCIAVDISMLEGVKTGDEVVMIGTQGGLESSVASFGEMSNMLNYELLTRLPTHIPRIVERITESR